MTKDKLRKLTEKALKQVSGKKTEIKVEKTQNPDFGDYSTNAAIALKKNPEKTASLIKSPILKKVETKNGFINFFLSEKYLQSQILEILKQKEAFGQLKTGKGKKAQIEFISANPTGPLTLANGRGGFLGNTLSNVMELAGFSTEREYYVNDTGNQIIVLGKSILAASHLIPKEDSFYQGSYIKKWAKENPDKIQKHKDSPLKLGQIAAKDFLRSIKQTVEKKAGIRFDRYTSENKDIHKKSWAKKSLDLFSKKGLVYEKDRALWLKTSNFGDDKDRVLVTSQGHPTYFLADSGHYLETKKRGFDLKINILGPDHYGYVSRIQAVAKILKIKESVVIITQAVRLVKEGKEFRMSKRKGEFVTFNDLIRETGADVAKFFFLQKSAASHLNFDLSLAKKQSEKNPVFYIQYAHARICSILKKSRVKKTGFQITKKEAELLKEPAELNLVKQLIRFPEIIELTATDYQVQRIPQYATELASSFHRFYKDCKVLTSDPSLSKARLGLVLATKIVLKKTLDLMGVSAPEKM